MAINRKILPYTSVIFLLLGAIYLIVAVFDAVKIISAWDWPETTGKITESAVESEVDSSGETFYFFKVRYQYSVNGITYTGGRISYTDSFSDSVKNDKAYETGGKITRFIAGRGMPTNYGDYVPSTAKHLSKLYPIDNEVAVYYDPDNPSESFLRQGGIAGRAMLRSIIFFFCAGGVIFFNWFYKTIKTSSLLF